MPSYVKLQHPEWSRDAVIYQVNTRQFTPEGTFDAARKELPRLKALGVDILWLMPIHPIGEKNRKGLLGSPYAVRDYYAVNPEFGDLDGLRRFVDAAHAEGFRVILDWVANHTAWDNPLVEQHPEWYSRDWRGQLHSPTWTDWSDVIQLDFSQPGLRRYMADVMAWWVREVGIDGFRCDVAGFVPLDFWDALRSELDAIRPVFMLAEWDERDLVARAFDATYDWGLYDTLVRVAQGRADVGALVGHVYNVSNAWPRDGMRLTFTSNHDKNAWEGSAPEAFGPALEAAIALSFVSQGIPMIYNGQEAGNSRRLAFFEKDPVEWRDDPAADLFRRLIALKKGHSALWNGGWGAPMVPVVHDSPSTVLAFVRFDEESSVFAAFNLSAEPQRVQFQAVPRPGRYEEFTTGEAADLADGLALDLAPWSYRIFSR